jgi:hypothetical protein
VALEILDDDDSQAYVERYFRRETELLLRCAYVGIVELMLEGRVDRTDRAIVRASE